MTDIQIETQYSTGVSRQAIEQALVAAGKDLDHLRPEDLALLEDFHTMGRIATAQLAVTEHVKLGVIRVAVQVDTLPVRVPARTVGPTPPLATRSRRAEPCSARRLR